MSSSKSPPTNRNPSGSSSGGALPALWFPPETIGVHERVNRGAAMTKNGLTRREWMRLSAAGVVGWSLSGWLETLAADTATNPERKRSCILLWMSGGPSQTDTFDLKPGHANGGPFKE